MMWRKRLTQVANWLKTQWPTVFIFLVLAGVLLANTFHEKYPDEFDNIAGGKMILDGVFPYSGFFTHHAPFAYFVSAMILPFSGISFVKFRVVLAVVYFLMHFGMYLYMKHRFGAVASRLSLIWSLFVVIAGTYMWGHMLVADSLSALLLTGSFMIVTHFIIAKKRPQIFDQILLSILLSLTVLTSLTYIYAVLIVYLIFLGYLLFSYRKYLQDLIVAIIILAVPYFLFLIYLLITKSLGDFYYQAVFFNTNYYVSSAGNPIRFAISIFVKFFEDFRLALVQIKEFNFNEPFVPTLALGSLSLIVIAVMRKWWLLGALTLGLIIFTNARSTPLSLGQNDYQGASYQYISLYAGILFVWLLSQKKNLNDAVKNVWMGLLIVYLFFLSLFLTSRFLEKTYDKYMGTAPLIYDRPAVAPIFNKLISDDEFYYIGPFAFEDHLYMNGKLASKYFITIPAMNKSEKIQSELLADLENNKPKLIVFDNEYVIFSSFPGEFLKPFLEDQYVTLRQLRNEGRSIEIKTQAFGSYDTESDFYLRRDRVDEVLRQLAEENVIEL